MALIVMRWAFRDSHYIYKYSNVFVFAFEGIFKCFITNTL